MRDVSRALLACLSSLAIACGPDVGSSKLQHSAESQVGVAIASPGRDSVITVRTVGTIVLGRDSSDSPLLIGLAVFTRGAVTVLDKAPVATIRRFSREGRQLFALTTGQEPLALLKTPMGASAVGDTVFVADMDPQRGLFAIGPDGSATRQALQVPSTVMDVAVSGRHVFVSTISDDIDIAADTGFFVYTLDRQGQLLSKGCRVDPEYASSLRRQGFYEMFRVGGVRVLNETVYCRQPLSPSVQLFNFSGRPVDPGRISVQPDFYLRGPDRSLSMNQRQIQRFLATWTAHELFSPTQDGFISIYSKADSLNGGSQRWVFRCWKGTGESFICGSASISGRVVGILPPDTLAVAEESSGAKPNVLRLQVVQ